jgi:hypothetical protein
MSFIARRELPTTLAGYADNWEASDEQRKVSSCALHRVDSFNLLYQLGQRMRRGVFTQ